MHVEVGGSKNKRLQFLKEYKFQHKTLLDSKMRPFCSKPKR